MKKSIISTLIMMCSICGAAQRYIEYADSADYYITRSEWDQAEASLLKALRLEPGNPGNALLLCNLGTVQANQGHIDDALQSFDIALVMSPRLTVALSNRARVLLEAGRESEAVEDLSKVLEIDPNARWQRLLRAFTLLKLNRSSEAHEDFVVLNGDTPDDVDVLEGLAQSCSLMGHNDDAIKYYTRAIELAPSAELLCSRALLHLHLERLSEADADISSAIKLNPRNGNLFAVRSTIRKRQHLNREAEQDRRTALDNNADPALLLQLSGY